LKVLILLRPRRVEKISMPLRCKASAVLEQ
jgi:hypothetical protein